MPTGAFYKQFLPVRYPVDYDIVCGVIVPRMLVTLARACTGSSNMELSELLVTLTRACTGSGNMELSELENNVNYFHYM